MKFVFIFFIFSTLSPCKVLAITNLQEIEEFKKEIKILKSIPDEDFYKELEKANQKYWEYFVKNYTQKYGLSTSDFPKEIPAEITLRIKGIPISEIKKMLDDPKKNLENTNKQYKDLLDGIRTKKWKQFSEQEWMKSQSGFQKPADSKEFDKQINDKTSENLDLEATSELVSFVKKPWFLTLAAFILFFIISKIFKIGK